MNEAPKTEQAPDTIPAPPPPPPNRWLRRARKSVEGRKAPKDRNRVFRSKVAK